MSLFDSVLLESWPHGRRANGPPAGRADEIPTGPGRMLFVLLVPEINMLHMGGAGLADIDLKALQGLDQLGELGEAEIVKRFSGRGYELEDLYQIGVMGFIKSIKRFDTSFDVKLSTYTVPYILGEIKRYIRDDGPIKVSRSIKELNVKIKELQRMYLLNKGKEITIEEISKILKVAKEDVAIALESSQPVESIEGSMTQDSGDKSLSLLERISTGKDEQEMVTNKIVLKQLLDGLEDSDKEVILLRYYKEKTQAQIAKILGISQVQVSRIEKKVLQKMRYKLLGNAS